jgi:ATP-binding cassette subfamily F protein 3
MANENLLQLQNGTKSYGARNLFNEASFSVNEEDHIGVIGPNGAGKSTLFKILIGEEGLDNGLIVKSRQLSVGYLSQYDVWGPTETGNEFLERTSQIPIWELKTSGRLLQVTEEILAKPIVSLSGGYRMRIKLLSLLGQSPNLMLLDEPTNYLDLETTLLLEKFLQSFSGAFLLISHDREFLRRTTDHILEIEAGDFTKFNGNIDDYFEQKELLRNQLESRAASLEEKKKTIMDFVNRFGAKATKAKQAQSRLKLIDKMETIEIKPLAVGAQIKIPAPSSTGKVVLKVTDAEFGYGERKILKKVNLSILNGDHVAVVGFNGAGKSTLLKGLSGLLKPLTGTSEWGYGVSTALFHQHVVEELDPTDTVLDSLMKAAHSSVLRQEILDMAGSLLFSGDDVQKTIKVLSGGEKSRVALGRVLLKKSPCLILDEPTNHLDFQTVEALTLALQNYAGTVIVVSHDRGFVRRVGTQILDVNQGEVIPYRGTYDEYVWSVEQKLKADEENGGESESSKKSSSASSNSANIEKENMVPAGKNWKEVKKEAEKRLRSCEKRISENEKEMEKLQQENEQLNESIIQASSPSKEAVHKLSENSVRINELELEWLELAETKEKCESEIQALMKN